MLSRNQKEANVERPTPNAQLEFSSWNTSADCGFVRLLALVVSRLLPAELDRFLAAVPAMSRFPTAPFSARARMRGERTLRISGQQKRVAGSCHEFDSQSHRHRLALSFYNR
jgi:hypothetical protein